MDRLRQWFAGLQARERRFLVAGAAGLAALTLIGGVLLPLGASLTRATDDAARRREDLEWMRINAPEIRSGATALRVPTNEPPVVLVARTAKEAGLAAALRSTQPSGGNAGVRVQLEGAPFDAMMLWLATLDQRYGLAVEAIAVDRAKATGTVDANVTFTQPAH
jgi:general secretion pathway protein M